MEKITKSVRIILGILMLIFGLNGFFQFMPGPQPSPEMGAFLRALAKTGYMFPFISVVKIVAGGLLLANIAAPLALILISPIMVNAFLAHLFLHDVGGIGAAALIVTMIVFLFYAYRETYFELLETNHYEHA